MPHLTRAALDRWRTDPGRRARAVDLQDLLDAYGNEREEVFVPDVAIAATIPVVREEMWFQGLGPMAYANMLRRFKGVLEPMIRPTVEGWRGRCYEEIIDERWRYVQELRPALDQRDRRDHVIAPHLRLCAIYDAFYGSATPRLIAAGAPRGPVYGDISDGTHRLFVAQALGSIDTLPAWVSWRTREISCEEIAAREEERRARAEVTDVVVIKLDELD